MWWPQIDKQTKETAHSCYACQSTQRALPKVPIRRWTRAPELWLALHVEFTGPVEGRTYLVGVDAHTKWLKVRHAAHSTLAVVISVLRSLFTMFGIPR